MRIGRYEVVSKVGETAMSVVYRGRGDDGADVAIKVLRSLNRKAWERFERERRMLALLGQDAGFVQCIEVVETQRGAALVMPFLSGGTLRDRLARGPFTIDEAAALARTLANGLARAHERGIVHRDVKPENILFAADGRAFIADLGIAKHFREDLPGASQTVAITRSQTVLGTVSYMPPEQMHDAKRAGPPADVYALGAVLYECIAGEPAHMGTNPLDLIRRVLKEDAAPLATKRRDCPAWLGAVVDRALARDQKKRFADAGELARALERAPEPAKGRSVVVLAAGAAVLLAAGAAALVVMGGRTDPSLPPPPPPPPIAAVGSEKRPRPAPPAVETAAVHVGTGVRLRTAHTVLTKVIGDVAAHYHGPIDFVALAPDDRKALTVSHRGDIVVWDLERGEEVTYPPAPGAHYWSLAFGLGGPRAVSASMQELRIWGPEGKGECAVVDSARSGQFSAVIARDGQRALVHTRGRLEVMDLDTRARVKTLVPGDDAGTGALLPLAFDMGRRLAVVGREYGQLHVFDTRTGEQIHTLTGHTRGATHGALSRDGERFLSSGPDETLRCFATTEKQLWQVPTDTGSILSIDVAPDGATFVVVTGERIELRDMATGELRRAFDASVPSCAAFTSDGARIFAGVEDGLLVAFDVKTGARLQAYGAPTPGGAESLRELADGRVIACNGPNVVTFDGSSGEEIAKYPWTDIPPVFTADGRAVAFSYKKNVIRIVAPDGKTLEEVPPEKIERPVVETSPDGKKLVLVDGDKMAAYDVVAKKWISPWSSKASGGNEVRVVVSNAGRALGWRNGQDAPIFLWDVDRGTKAARIDEHRVVTAAAISADGTRALLGGADGAVTLWPLATLKPSATVTGHTREVTNLTFLSATRAVSASLDRTVRLWDVSGAELGLLDTIDLGPLVGPVMSLGPGPDGRSFLVGSENRAILRFQLSD